MNYNLSDSELSQVCEVIAARIGLHFPVERWAILGRNLSLAAHEFDSRKWMDSFTGFCHRSSIRNKSKYWHLILQSQKHISGANLMSFQRLQILYYPD